MTISSVAALSGVLRSNLLKALAVTTPQRTSTLPDVPTMIEAGIPGFIVTQWHGIVAPAGTPKPIVERLYQAIAKSLKQPDVSTRLSADGTDAVGSSPETIRSAYESGTCEMDAGDQAGRITHAVSNNMALLWR